MTNVNMAFVVGIALNIVFVGIEAFAGWWTHSLALLSDAGHNLSDVASLALSLLAFRLSKVRTKTHYTYGFRKATILAALVNALLLIGVIVGIVYEALLRFRHPEPMQGLTTAWVALIGIGVNSFSAYLFMKDREKDLNLKGAYLHLAADALISLGVVVGGLVIYATQWLWLDSAISLVIAFVILVGTWHLLTDSLRLSMDGVPQNINVNEIQQKIRSLGQVEDFHHIHVWAISTTQNALTAHLVLKGTTKLCEVDRTKDQVKHELLHLNVHHSTIEVHAEGTDCQQEPC